MMTKAGQASYLVKYAMTVWSLQARVWYGIGPKYKVRDFSLPVLFFITPDTLLEEGERDALSWVAESYTHTLDVIFLGDEVLVSNNTTNLYRTKSSGHRHITKSLSANANWEEKEIIPVTVMLEPKYYWGVLREW